MTSPATRLLEKRRQLYEVTEAFEMQKRRSEQEEIRFDKKEREIKDRDVQLQHQLVRFNKFLQDNEAKRKRAEHRANEEVKEIKVKDQQISDLENRLKHVKAKEKDLLRELTDVASYEEFLASVVSASSTNFTEISDLVARHGTLVNAHRDLLATQRDLELKNEAVRAEVVEMRKKRTAEFMALSNEAAALLTEREETEKRRRALEYDAEAVASRDAEQTEIVGDIFRSIDNIFARVIGQRPVIQHAASLAGVGVEGGPVEESPNGQEVENLGFFEKRTAESIGKLRCLEAYARDLKEIAELARREVRAAATLKANARERLGADAYDRIAEPEFVKAGALHDRTGVDQMASSTIEGSVAQSSDADLPESFTPTKPRFLPNKCTT